MENRIKILDVKKVQKPKTIEIYEVTFMQKDKKIVKEVAKSKNVVKILLYHEE